MDAWPLTLLEAARTREEHTTREDAMEERWRAEGRFVMLLHEPRRFYCGLDDDGDEVYGEREKTPIAEVFEDAQVSPERIARLPQLERDLAAARAALRACAETAPPQLLFKHAAAFEGALGEAAARAEGQG